jgi:hypothetical protein
MPEPFLVEQLREGESFSQENAFDCFNLFSKKIKFYYVVYRIKLVFKFK